jgi:glutathione peroxidase
MKGNSMNLSYIIPVCVLALAAGAAIAWQAAKAPAPTPPVESKPAVPEAKAPPEKPDPYVLAHTMKLIDEKTDKNLKDYEGKVVLIINVASKCGYTKQYKGLETLYQTYKDKGLVILGFPANDFGGQEPGTNAEIQQFCTSSYSVTFPMFAKIEVTGEKAAPLFKQLAALSDGKPPSWNFNKYLVGKDGKFVAHFETRTKPDDDTLVKAIREALGIAADEKVPAPAAPDKK